MVVCWLQDKAKITRAISGMYLSGRYGFHQHIKYSLRQSSVATVRMSVQISRSLHGALWAKAAVIFYKRTKMDTSLVWTSRDLICHNFSRFFCDPSCQALALHCCPVYRASFSAQYHLCPSFRVPSLCWFLVSSRAAPRDDAVSPKLFTFFFPPHKKTFRIISCLFSSVLLRRIRLKTRLVVVSLDSVFSLLALPCFNEIGTVGTDCVHCLTARFRCAVKAVCSLFWVGAGGCTYGRVEHPRLTNLNGFAVSECLQIFLIVEITRSLGLPAGHFLTSDLPFRCKLVLFRIVYCSFQNFW